MANTTVGTARATQGFIVNGYWEGFAQSSQDRSSLCNLSVLCVSVVN